MIYSHITLESHSYDVQISLCLTMANLFKYSCYSNRLHKGKQKTNADIFSRMKNISLNILTKTKASMTVCLWVTTKRRFINMNHTSVDFNFVKPCFDLLQFSYNFVTKGFSN